MFIKWYFAAQGVAFPYFTRGRAFPVMYMQIGNVRAASTGILLQRSRSERVC